MQFIETGESDCPQISRGKRLAAIAISEENVVPIPAVLEKDSSSTLISAPESTKARKGTRL